MSESSQKLHRLLNRVNVDQVRLRCNRLWAEIHDVAFSVLGPIATFAFGEVTGEFLDKNYIKHFREHLDREQLREFVSEQHSVADLPFIRLCSDPRTGKRNYITSYSDFHLEKLLGGGGKKSIALLGNVGCGKTSLIAYTLGNLPKDVCLLADNLAFCKTEEHVLTDIYTSVPEQAGRWVLRAGEEKGMNLRQIQTELHRAELEHVDGISSEQDDHVERELKEQRRSHVILKMMDAKVSRGRDAQLYLRPAIKFLKKHGKKPIIVLDDIDRITDEAAEKAARDEAIFLAEILDVPVMIAAREVTVRKGLDIYGYEQPLHLCAPSFKDVLERRLETFKQELEKSPPEPVLIKDTRIETNDYISIVERAIRSILDDSKNIYFFQMLSNGSIALMLDYLRTILSSPHLSDDDILELLQRPSIKEHRILECLMLYVYTKINPWNTYLLNLFNANHPERGAAFNALFKVRLLQCIKAGATQIQGFKITDYKTLQSNLESLGYSDGLQEVLDNQIREMDTYGLIEVWIFDYKYKEKNTNIMLRDAGYLYLDHLLERYRYIQTVIPDCWLDYEASAHDLALDLPYIDTEIEKFIKFISRCEEIEGSKMPPEGEKLLNSVQDQRTLSVRLKNAFADERARQMGKSERR